METICKKCRFKFDYKGRGIYTIICPNCKKIIKAPDWDLEN